MKYEKIETCTSVIFHLTKSVDVKDFARILIEEYDYNKKGEIANNIELMKNDVYVIIGRKTIVVESDNDLAVREIEDLIKSL